MQRLIVSEYCIDFDLHLLVYVITHVEKYTQDLFGWNDRLWMKESRRILIIFADFFFFF